MFHCRLRTPSHQPELSERTLQCTLLIIAVLISLAIIAQIVTVCQHFFLKKFSFFPVFSRFFPIFEQVFDCHPGFSTAFSTNRPRKVTINCNFSGSWFVNVGAAIGRPPTNCHLSFCLERAARASPRGEVAARRADGRVKHMPNLFVLRLFSPFSQIA